MHLVVVDMAFRDEERGKLINTFYLALFEFIYQIMCSNNVSTIMIAVLLAISHLQMVSFIVIVSVINKQMSFEDLMIFKILGSPLIVPILNGIIPSSAIYSFSIAFLILIVVVLVIQVLSLTLEIYKKTTIPKVITASLNIVLQILTNILFMPILLFFIQAPMTYLINNNFFSTLDTNNGMLILSIILSIIGGILLIIQCFIVQLFLYNSGISMELPIYKYIYIDLIINWKLEES